MKRFNWAFVLLVMGILMLAGCGSAPAEGTTSNSASGETEGSGESEGSGKTEITYWYAWGDKIQENNENLVKMFNESQDQIHVTAEYQGSYDDLHAKTQAAFAAGNAPEVTQNEIASVGVFASNGMTENLTPFVENDDIQMDDFVEGLMGNSYVDGNLHALPYLRSTPILYLNTTILEEAGLDPAGPKTWEEFEEYATKLTVEGERVGITMPIDIWFFEGFVAQSGGTMLNEEGTEIAFNEQPGVEALTFWKELEDKGVLKVPTGDEAGDQAKQDFGNGRSAMLFSSTADLSYLLGVASEQSFDLNTTFMPANEDFGVPTGGANLVMTAGLDEEKQQAAWEFIKWMTAKEQTIYASKYTGYLPSRTSAIESDEMKALYEEKPQFRVAVDQLEYANPRPMAEAYPEITKLLKDQIMRVVLEDLDPQEAMNELAEQGNGLLK
ncbi:ABC transporter substrate-binding protein [Aureibacillus halotolerans]|uniref:Carbohydrate ABC transporter substrate-binding protein (CUT1 family) n=1 Tax=Aureibacillus halotolerans TaxID=1508390 RepID=A0A4V3D674_9BACI|nr:ABC transporter substrate-binding protein [Aureibacillus halotolerans]TDQ42847.1 carbohydrate ABC transporter substrate-binding protein (CUT1 family) [Aureibacillus halotolerans]